MITLVMIKIFRHATHLAGRVGVPGVGGEHAQASI